MFSVESTILLRLKWRQDRTKPYDKLLKKEFKKPKETYQSLKPTQCHYPPGRVHPSGQQTLHTSHLEEEHSSLKTPWHTDMKNQEISTRSINVTVTSEKSTSAGKSDISQWKTGFQQQLCSEQPLCDFIVIHRWSTKQNLHE